MTAKTRPATYFQTPRPGSTCSIRGAKANAISAAMMNHDDVMSTSMPAIDPTRSVPGGLGARCIGVIVGCNRLGHTLTLTNRPMVTGGGARPRARPACGR